MVIYLVIGLVFQWWWTMIGGMILTVLNAIAMKVNQKNRTVSITDFE